MQTLRSWGLTLVLALGWFAQLATAKNVPGSPWVEHPSGFYYCGCVAQAGPYQTHYLVFWYPKDPTHAYFYDRASCRVWVRPVSDCRRVELKKPDPQAEVPNPLPGGGPATPVAEGKKKLNAFVEKTLALKKQGRFADAIKECINAIDVGESLFAKKDRATEVAPLYDVLAELYTASNQFAAAERVYEKTREIRETWLGKDDTEVAKNLSNQANLFMLQGKFDKAESFINDGLRIRQAKLGKDHPDTATSTTQLGELHHKQGRFAEADRLYSEALELRERKLGKDHADVALSLNRLARLRRDQGQPEKAEPLYERSLRIAQAKHGNDSVEVETTHDNLGDLFYTTKQYDRAEPHLQQVLASVEKRLGTDHLEAAAAHQHLAAMYREMQQLDRAEEHAQRALTIREQQLGKDAPGVAVSLVGLAAVARKQGHSPRAEDHLQRAVKILEGAGDANLPDLADALNAQAELYVDLGQTERATALRQRSLEVQALANGRRASDSDRRQRSDRVTTLANQARVSLSQGNYDETEKLVKQALDAAEQKLGKDHPTIADILNLKGLLHEVRQQYDQAEATYQRSLKLMEKARGENHADLVKHLRPLAGLYSAQGKYPQSEELLQRGLRIVEDAMGKDTLDVANVLDKLAELYWTMGADAKAIPTLQRSLGIREAKLGAEHPSLVGPQISLALVKARGERWGEAADAFERANRILRRHLGSVLPNLSEQEMLSFLKTNHEGNFQGSLSLGLARLEDAGMSERSAAWVLNGKGMVQQSLAGREQLARDSAEVGTAKLLRELISVRQQLASLQLSGSRKKTQQEELAQREQDVSKLLAQRTGRQLNAPWIEVGKVREALPAGSVLIEIARFLRYDFQAKATDRPWQAAHYVAWIIPPAGQGDVQVVDLGDAAMIDQAVKQARAAIQSMAEAKRTRSEADAEKEARNHLKALAERVLDPILAHAGQAERWVISPDADLWLAPWTALPLDDGYLIEKHQVRFAVSGRDLLAPAGRVATSAPVVLADPDYDLKPEDARAQTSKVLKEDPAQVAALRGANLRGTLPSFPRLPGTAAEAEAIAPLLRQYADAEPVLFTGKQALEGVFKALRRPRVLVVSTHGFFQEDQEAALEERTGLVEENVARKPLQNPLLRCGLVFAGANRRAEPGTAVPTDDDGLLTGLEILATDLRGCELVVLSACDTGVGEVRNGEGVAGLRQAFQLAGAKSVASTLWKIPDQETAKLMTAFFGHLAKGTERAEALRLAQLELIKARRDNGGAAHPFFWAAFTLTE